MRGTLRIGLVGLLMLALAAPAFAQDKGGRGDRDGGGGGRAAGTGFNRTFHEASDRIQRLRDRQLTCARLGQSAAAAQLGCRIERPPRTAGRPDRTPDVEPPRRRPPRVVETPRRPKVPPRVTVERPQRATPPRAVVETPRRQPPAKAVVTRSPPPTPPGPPPARPGVPLGPLGVALLPPAGETRFVPDEVVVEFAPGQTPAAIDALAQGQRLALIEAVDFALLGGSLRHYRITDGRSVPTVLAALGATTGVASAQPNYLYTLQQQPAAGFAGAAVLPQYALDRIKVRALHAARKGAVDVAVIDSAVDTNHPDLAGAVVHVFDAVNDNDPAGHTHGTAIAGILGARATLMGVAPGARILAVRAFSPRPDGSERKGTSMAVAKGLDFAATRRVRIVNMSFAGPQDPLMARLLKAADQAGIVLIAASGNAGPTAAPLFPAADPHVIAVTATNDNDALFEGANRGTHVAVAAPGVDILAPVPGGSYQTLTGTSMAAAVVSGVAALLIEADSGLGPKEIRAILTQSATDLGAPGPDPEFGAGRIDAEAAATNGRGQKKAAVE